MLTIEEMREAAGVPDGSKDAQLRKLEAAVAAAIMSECNVAVGAGAEPTLLQETLTEVFYGSVASQVVLSRRHNVLISAVTVDEVPLVSGTDFIVGPETGILQRLSGGYPCSWNGQSMTVVYQAGFAIVPPEIKDVATDMFRANVTSSARDPYVKGQEIEIPGVERKRTDFWIGAVPGQGGTEGAVPDILAGRLKRFRNAAAA